MWFNAYKVEGKKYYSIHGPDLDKRLPWKLMVYQYTEDKYFKGNFGVSVCWPRPKFYSTLDELLSQIALEQE